jgi:hypothetical protein
MKDRPKRKEKISGWISDGFMAKETVLKRAPARTLS